MTTDYDVQELLKLIKFRVEERREKGLYPVGLEQQLESEFAEIMSSTNRRYFTSIELQREIQTLEDSIRRLSGRVSTQSRIPGVALIHKVLSWLTRRQLHGLTAQVRDVETQTLSVIKMLGDFANSQEDADRRIVQALSQHVLDRVSVVDHLAILMTDLESRIRLVENQKTN
jgi:hypothetical protein